MTYLLYLPVLKRSAERIACFKYHFNDFLWSYGYF